MRSDQFTDIFYWKTSGAKLPEETPSDRRSERVGTPGYFAKSWPGWSRPPEPLSRPVSEERDQIGMGLIGLIAMLLVAIYLAKRTDPANGTTAEQEPRTDWLKSLLANPSDGAGKAAEAFALRNRGFYVDYVGGHWRSPASLGAAEERTMRAFALPLVRGDHDVASGTRSLMAALTPELTPVPTGFARLRPPRRGFRTRSPEPAGSRGATSASASADRRLNKARWRDGNLGGRGEAFGLPAAATRLMSGAPGSMREA